MRRSDELFEGIYPGRAERFATLKSFALLLGVGALIGAIFFGGEYVQRLRAYQEARPGVSVGWLEPLRTIALNTNDELPRPIAASRLLESGLPVYDLRIAPKDMATLQGIAEQVTSRIISTGIERVYVPASFRAGADDEWRPIDVKLRGLYFGHYLKNRPSLRLKFPGDRLFDGKKQINLSQPYDKGLTVDVTTNWELERYGILTWESQFVVLRVNGRTLGVFQEIEQFGRAMGDRSGRPEGFIFSGYGQLFGKEGFGYDKARAAMTKFETCRADDGKPVPADCNWEFLRKNFDVDRWAWAAALIVLLRSDHAWHPDNVRMFWDPALGSFEPIPWDYAHYPLDVVKTPEGETVRGGYRHAVNRIPEFRRQRDVRLWALLTERVEPMLAHADALF